MVFDWFTQNEPLPTMSVQHTSHCGVCVQTFLNSTKYSLQSHLDTSCTHTVELPSSFSASFGVHVVFYKLHTLRQVGTHQLVVFTWQDPLNLRAHILTNTHPLHSERAVWLRLSSYPSLHIPHLKWLCSRISSFTVNSHWNPQLLFFWQITPLRAFPEQSVCTLSNSS